MHARSGSTAGQIGGLDNPFCRVLTAQCIERLSGYGDPAAVPAVLCSLRPDAFRGVKTHWPQRGCLWHRVLACGDLRAERFPLSLDLLPVFGGTCHFHMLYQV